MSKYKYICNLSNLSSIGEFKELIPLLTLLEKVNPCNQTYEFLNNSVVISYYLKLNLLNFKNIFPLKINAQIIGLPISLCLKGYSGNNTVIEEMINKRKGLKVLLNADCPFKGGGKTLSTFVFENNFSSFKAYLNALRSPYRRRINKALNYKEKLIIRKLNNSDFSKEHYYLYLSVMNRTENPLETLSIEFFKEYDAELYEFIDKENNRVVGFIQLKELNNKLYFLFGGFRKKDIEKYDIYYNMLLKIIEIGIEKSIKEIEFGQTAEESKLKVGCKEKCKYLYVHHSNLILNFIIQKLIPNFSYRSYPIKHHVFKIED